jgi:hypothetical protein
MAAAKVHKVRPGIMTPTKLSACSQVHPEGSDSPSGSAEEAQVPCVLPRPESNAQDLWSSPVEALVKLRTKATRGAGSPAAALAMVFKLIESAQARWRAITGAHLVPLARTGARCENGQLVERKELVA